MCPNRTREKVRECQQQQEWEIMKQGPAIRGFRAALMSGVEQTVKFPGMYPLMG